MLSARRLCTLLAAIAVLAAAPACSDDDGDTNTGAGTGDDTSEAAGAAVTIADFAFSPKTITAKVGDTVTWTNNEADAAHSVEAKDGSFESEDLASGETFDHEFTEAGTFDYQCGIHNSMTGTVTVE